jgi:hypothetical protein
LAIEPTRIYLGRISKDANTPERHVILAGIDKDITKIESVISKNSHIKAEVVLPEFDGKDKNHRIKVAVLPGMKIGRFREKITVNTDHKELKKLTFYVSGEVVGNITVIPPYLSFGIFRKGGKYNKNIRLKAAPGVSFKVLDVNSATPDLNPKLIVVNEGTDYLVKVYLEEGFDKNTLNGKITITTDDKEQERIFIKVSGRAYDYRRKRVSSGKAHQK